jgi:hypothetical protein
VTRTIKLRCDGDPAFAAMLAEQRRLQSRLVRTAYRRLAEGVAQRELYATLRAQPVGQGLNTWLILSGMKKAASLYARHPEGKVVFGGRRALVDRARGRMTHEEWRAARLMALYVEGHARSYGTQGGNHLLTLDIAADRVIYHGPNGHDYALRLLLSKKSRQYRRRLGDLQARCESLRDVPFTVSIDEREIALTWRDPPVEPARSIAGRVLALDLNPSRFGWAVVERGAEPGSCRCVAWGLFEYPELGRRLGLASDHPKSIAQVHKRRFEMALLAKKQSFWRRTTGYALG